MYLCRTYAGQLDRGQRYDELCSVVGVHLVAMPLLPGRRFHSIFRLLETKSHEPYTDGMELHVVELGKVDDGPFALEEPALARWARFLMADTDEERAAAVRGDATMEKANAELARLSADPTMRELARRRELAYRLNEIERAIVRKEGREEGREEGRSWGLLEASRDGLLRVLESRNLHPPPEIAEVIASCDDRHVLQTWLVRAASAQSLDDVFSTEGHP